MRLSYNNVSLIENVDEFKRLNEMPVPLCFGEDVDVDQLIKNEAKWHKSCHLKFSVSKLDRARGMNSLITVVM